jgi:pimeloyl-ACP methyl ester carboxylesterase
MRAMMNKTLALLACFACLSGCSATLSGRAEQAADLAAPAQLQRVEYSASPFVLAGWQKITRPGEPVHLYIEGDGLAWLGRGALSPNPTPKNPVALMLASNDAGSNVVYLARPCQYTALDAPGNAGCSDAAYWSSKRFSQTVVNSYMRALDEIAGNTGAKEFHITGYSGGANIAGLLAARRSDIAEIRTVAGNIDNDFFTQFHKVSAMPQSLNMADDAARLATIPQIHFIGAEDIIVPADIFQSYAKKFENTSCVHYKMVPGASHTEGWEKAWPALLNIPVSCQ